MVIAIRRPAHADTGTLWQNEDGAQGGDEFNLIERGKNYGWPGHYSTEATIHVDRKYEDMERPIHCCSAW